MKSFFKLSGAIAIGMALVLILQSGPAQEITKVKAQTSSRPIAGPGSDGDPFSSTFLTPTSTTLNTNLPVYALPRIYLQTSSQPTLSQTIDINADGLLDFVYSYYASSVLNQYVILNTGNGFDLAYVCQDTLSGGVHTYKGDCAQ